MSLQGLGMHLVIPGTREVVIRRVKIRGQPRQKVIETQSQQTSWV
jgi:hypothetical protein